MTCCSSVGRAPVTTTYRNQSSPTRNVPGRPQPRPTGSRTSSDRTLGGSLTGQRSTERPTDGRISPMTLPATLTAAFQQTASRYPHSIALSTADGSVRITWRQYADRVQKLAAGLTALGVKRGDTVGLMLTNRPEFHLLDTATLHTGATPFSIYNTLAPEQIAHLFGNAGNQVVICEKQFLDQIRAATAATG